VPHVSRGRRHSRRCSQVPPAVCDSHPGGAGSCRFPNLDGGHALPVVLEDDADTQMEPWRPDSRPKCEWRDQPPDLDCGTSPLEIPGAGSINVYDWDRSFDGTRIAFSGSAIDRDGRADFFVAWISSDGTNAVIRRTSRYIPRRIAIAADGTLWTAGQELNGPPDAGVFRHFDRAGKLLGAFVPRSSFPDPIVLYDHTGRMRASKDRVVWYSPRGSRYMEISLQGAVLADISLKPPDDAWNGYGFALTDRGDVFLSSLQYVPPAGGPGSVGIWRINVLDKATAAWKPVLQRSFRQQNIACARVRTYIWSR